MTTKLCIDKELDNPFEVAAIAINENPQNRPSPQDMSQPNPLALRRLKTLDWQALPDPGPLSDIIDITLGDIDHPVVAEVDKATPPSVSREMIHRAHLALNTKKFWENGRTLRIVFMGGNPAVQQKVIQFAKEWEEYANIRLDFSSPASDQADIRIAFELGAGSWSYMGTDALGVPKDEPTMNFGWLTSTSSADAVARVVLHEFGHALGAIHEHQHPKNEIPWNKEAVYNYYGAPPNNWSREKVDRNLFQKYDSDQITYSRFDRASIMLYPISNELTVGDWEVGWNGVLSDMDKEHIGKIYPKNGVSHTSSNTGLILGAAPVEASISQPGERTTFQFDAGTQARYVFETTGSSDTVMSLSEAGKADLLAEDDDGSDEGFNAKIEQELAPGSYTVAVWLFDNDQTGRFGISVKQAAD